MALLQCIIKHMNRVRTIGLDLGSTLGWAVAIDNAIVDSGSITVHKDSKEAWGQSLSRLWYFLTELVYESPYKEEYPVVEIVFESVQFSKFALSTLVYGRLLGILQLFAHTGGIPTYTYTPSEIKKYFTGMGNSKKDEMCARAHELGWKGGKYGTALYSDEADAIGVIFTHMARRGTTAYISNKEEGKNHDK